AGRRFFHTIGHQPLRQACQGSKRRTPELLKLFYGILSLFGKDLRIECHRSAYAAPAIEGEGVGCSRVFAMFPHEEVFHHSEWQSSKPHLLTAGEQRSRQRRRVDREQQQQRISRWFLQNLEQGTLCRRIEEVSIVQYGDLFPATDWPQAKQALQITYLVN